MPYPFLTVAEAAQNDHERYIHFAHQGGNAPLSLVQFGWHLTNSCYGYGPMVRDHCLIHFIVSGKGRVLASDMEYHVHAGECFAIFPHQIAYYQSDQQEPWTYYWLGFEGAWSIDLMKSAGFSHEMIVRPIVEQALLFDILQRGIELEMDADNAMYFSGLLQQALHHLISRPMTMEERLDTTKRNYNQLGNEYVRIVTSIIETSFRERLSVNEMAASMGLNRSYLTTLFKEHTGMSIQEYLIEFRLQQTILRLQRSQYSIKQAALECGFNDSLYYSRLFKAHFGVSPRLYRATQDQGEKTIDRSDS